MTSLNSSWDLFASVRSYFLFLFDDSCCHIASHISKDPGFDPQWQTQAAGSGLGICWCTWCREGSWLSGPDEASERSNSIQVKRSEGG